MLETYSSYLGNKTFHGPVQQCLGNLSNSEGEILYARAGFRNTTSPSVKFISFDLSTGNLSKHYSQNVTLDPKSHIAHKLIWSFSDKTIVATFTGTVYLNQLNNKKKYDVQHFFNSNLGEISHVRINEHVALAASKTEIKYIDLSDALKSQDLTDQLKKVSLSDGMRANILEIFKETIFVASEKVITIKSLKNLELTSKIEINDGVEPIRSIHVISEKLFLTGHHSEVIEWRKNEEGKWQNKSITKDCDSHSFMDSYEGKIFLLTKKIFRVFELAEENYREVGRAELKLKFNPNAVKVLPGKKEGAYFIGAGNGEFIKLVMVRTEKVSA